MMSRPPSFYPLQDTCVNLFVYYFLKSFIYFYILLCNHMFWRKKEQTDYSRVGLLFFALKSATASTYCRIDSLLL